MRQAQQVHTSRRHPSKREIAVPNDATNESCSFNLLQSAGLTNLMFLGTALATVANIKENPKNLKITELDASQTARSLSLTAVVKQLLLQRSKLDYKKHLFKEQADENSKQWSTSSLRKRLGTSPKLMLSRK